MSKYNKVNPGIYTQRGRLTPDEAARELRKQSATSPGRTSQSMPVEARPSPASAGGVGRGASPSGEAAKAPAAKGARRSTTMPTTGTSPKTAVSPKARKATAAATKRVGTAARKAVLARNAGGPGAAPRRSAKTAKR